MKSVAQSKQKMREFFIDDNNEYLPPDRDLTAEFCRQVLAGEKDLLHEGLVKKVANVP